MTRAVAEQPDHVQQQIATHIAGAPTAEDP
jgi:hypothetical protein